MVVYDQSTRDVTGLAADSFLSILLGKLDSCFHSVSILTGRTPGLLLPLVLVPLVWSHGAVATHVHLRHWWLWHQWARGPRRLDPPWHCWFPPVHSFLAPSSPPPLHLPARVNERGGYRRGHGVIQPPKSCPSFPQPGTASPLVNVPRAGPSSGTLLLLAAVKGRAGEEIHGCARKGKEGRGRGSSLGESGSAGGDAPWARGHKQEEARAALITALLQSKMGGRRPMNEML